MAAPDKGDVTLLGRECSETALRAVLAREPGRRFRVCHFACHGLVHPTVPHLSALALTPTSEDDGMLTCLDVAELDLRADLAVLSACETARGQEIRGEGSVGLFRSFLAAGIPRVVATLWKIDDGAALAFTRAFYAALRKGATPAGALSAAQDRLRSSKEWRDPRHWAAWVLWGLPD